MTRSWVGCCGSPRIGSPNSERPALSDRLQLLRSAGAELSDSRVVTSSDFGAPSSLAWLTGELHTDEEYARRNSQFGHRILAGPVLFSLACGLWYSSVAPGFAR